jgi:hypothetical protein
LVAKRAFFSSDRGFNNLLKVGWCEKQRKLDNIWSKVFISCVHELIDITHLRLSDFGLEFKSSNSPKRLKILFEEFVVDVL